MKQGVKLKHLHAGVRSTQKELNVYIRQKWLMGIAGTLGAELQHFAQRDLWFRKGWRHDAAHQQCPYSQSLGIRIAEGSGLEGTF